MSEPVIRVENLGKKYRIRHQTEGRRYKTLRDALTAAPKRLWSKMCNASNADAGTSASEDFWALRDVSFTIQQGEAVGIIGRNGAGKSTLLKLLSRITEPTTGRIELEGRVASLLEVGTGFHPELTGRENIYLNGSILGMGRLEIRNKFDEIVAFAEVEKFLDTPVKHYSSGMYMKLAFSVAAHLEPQILVVDEVLAVGDIGFQKKCLGKMNEIATGGRTIIFVSHNMQAILSLTERSISMDRGKIWKVGFSKSVVEAYEQAVNGSSQSGTVDLTSSSRGGGDGKIRFRRISLKSATEAITASFAFGDPILITIEFQSSIRSTEFEVGFSVRAIDGTILFTGSSSDRGKLLHVEEGTYKVHTSIDPNYLKPGHFFLSLGITCGNLRDFVPEAIQFEVNTSKLVTKSPLISLPGHLHFEYQFQMEPVAT